MVDLIVRDVEPTNLERHRILLDHLEAASKGGQGMISALGHYASAQRRDLAAQACVGEDLVRDALRELRSTFGNAGAEVIVNPLGPIIVDRSLMIEAIKHLLHNALKFRRPDVAPAIEISLQPDERDWVARIVDNGIGLDASQHDAAFQMFYRRRPGDENAGVGAGLTIARRIFRRHGGDLRFISAIEGACIEMRLPQRANGKGA
ncbi:MAG TPA: ATP-binding protein [Caulobacteraceae bacterium]|nr:ATP-binding protein [Caulobacteraceae bacterium]